MDYSLSKQLQKICLSERLLQLSYNDSGFKLLDSIKKCNIIFRIEEAQISDYVQNLVLDTNETGVGVNYNMYDFGSFEKLLEALKYMTDDCENLKLSSLSKKVYSKFMSTLCTYISIITSTDRVINFLEHIKPFGVFCLDKDVLVNLQPLDRIESTILVNGKVKVHDNIPLVLPLEKIMNLYNIENYACPLPIFAVVSTMPGIFGENVKRYPQHITNVYDFQSTIEATKNILDSYSSVYLSSSTSSNIYPKHYVHLPYGIGFYIGTPQMTSYGALMECNKQILSYQDFPLVSHLTYTVGTILLGYIYPEGVTFQYNQIKHEDGSFSLYFYSYTYTCQNEWKWKTFTKKQLLTNTDKALISSSTNIESDENKSQINISKRFYQNIKDTINQDINKIEENIGRYAKDNDSDDKIHKQETQLHYLQKQKDGMMHTMKNIEQQKANYEEILEKKNELETQLFKALKTYITDIKENNNSNLEDFKQNTQKIQQDIDKINEEIKNHFYIYKCFNKPTFWSKKPANDNLITSVVDTINSLDKTSKIKHKVDIKEAMTLIYNKLDDLPFSYSQSYINFDYLTETDKKIEDEEIEGKEEEQAAQEKEENEDKTTPKKKVEPVIVNSWSFSSKDIDKNKHITLESQQVLLKPNMKQRRNKEGFKRQKIVEIQEMKSNL